MPARLIENFGSEFGPIPDRGRAVLLGTSRKVFSGTPFEYQGKRAANGLAVQAKNINRWSTLFHTAHAQDQREIRYC